MPARKRFTFAACFWMSWNLRLANCPTSSVRSLWPTKWRGEASRNCQQKPVGTVLRVSGIVESVRPHVLMHEAEALHESFGIALVRFRKRGGVRGDSHGVPSEGAIGRPRQIGGVGAAGEGHDYAAHGGEIGQQLLL